MALTKPYVIRSLKSLVQKEAELEELKELRKIAQDNHKKKEDEIEEERETLAEHMKNMAELVVQTQDGIFRITQNAGHAFVEEIKIDINEFHLAE